MALQSPRRTDLALVFAAALFAWAPTLAGGFLSDDQSIIVENERVHSLARVPALFVTPYWGFEGQDRLYRPIATATYALDWALGPSPGHFHLTNLLLHALASALVWLLARRLDERPAVALFAGLLFAVHPAHAEAVAMVVGRAEVLACLFALAGTIAFLRFREAEGMRGSVSWYALATVCYLLGVGSKETALVTPGLIALCEGTRALRRPESARRPAVRWLAPYVGLALAAAACLAWRSNVLGGIGTGSTLWDPFAAWERAAIAIGVLGDCVRMLFLPIGLAGDYAVNEDPRLALGAGGLVWASVTALGLAAIAVGALRAARRAPAWAFTAGWLALSLLPASNLLVPISWVKAERFLYLPSVGAAFLVADWLAGAEGRWRGVAWAIVGACLLAALSYSRAWLDERAWFAHQVARDPRFGAAWAKLGNAHRRAGEMEQARECYDRALKESPENSTVRLIRARWFRALGDAERAVAEYAAAQKGRPQPPMWQERVQLLQQLGRMPEAGRDVEEMLRRWPENPALLDSAGLYHLAGKGDAVAATALFEKAVALAPGVALPAFHLGVAWHRRGDARQARRWFARAVELDPTLADEVERIR